MSLKGWITEEVQAGLPSVQGTRADFFLPVRRDTLDQLLPLVPGVPQGLAILFGPDQQLQVRYGSFFANAKLRPDVLLQPAPIITIELASQLVAWGLQRAPLPPFVRVSGRLVQISLAQVPALQGLGALWAHLDRLTCLSTPSGIEVSGAISVKAMSSPARHVRPTRQTEGDGSMTDGRLQAWVRDQLAAGLPALAGARFTGTVPVPVAVAERPHRAGPCRRGRRHPSSARAPSDGAPDLATLARLVRHVRVDAAPGVITLDFEVGVDEQTVATSASRVTGLARCDW